jgi:hypothetical protein
MVVLREAKTSIVVVINTHISCCGQVGQDVRRHVYMPVSVTPTRTSVGILSSLSYFDMVDVGERSRSNSPEAESRGTSTRSGSLIENNVV